MMWAAVHFLSDELLGTKATNALSSKSLEDNCYELEILSCCKLLIGWSY